VVLGVPNAFAGLRSQQDNLPVAGDLIYFSFVTLTSTGYGDIVPSHPFARGLANVEAIIGQLYPATLLARLVTLEVESRLDR
jgi:Ion channel